MAAVSPEAGSVEAGARPSAPVPRETLARCALRAQLRGDPMLGTAFPASRLLLVEQPGPWGHGGLRESRFPSEVALELEARARNLTRFRVQAIRRPGRSPRRGVRRFALVDTRDGREAVWWGDYTDPRELLDLNLDAPPPVPGARLDRHPVFLVCAHSKHDACCAVRGKAVAAALAAESPGRVWETSHVGGDRFAANVLVLPVGLMYGRLLPFAAPQFVAAAEAGEVIGPLLRGRVGLPPAAQAALAYAHDQLALRHRRDLVVVHTGAVVDGVTTVRLDGVRGPLDVTVAVAAVPADGLTCKAPGATYFNTYRPLRIERVRAAG